MATFPQSPVRRVALPFGGDAWAQPDTHLPPPATEQALIATGGQLLFRVKPYDGTGLGASVVDGDASTVDMVVVKVHSDGHGNINTAKTKTTVETEGAQVNVGKQFRERSIMPGEKFYIGFVTATQDAADALWVFVDAGAELADG